MTDEIDSAKKISVLLIVFNRPHLVEKQLRFFQGCASISDIYISCDGPRNSNDSEKINEIKEIVEKYQGCGKGLNLNFRKNNNGCGQGVKKSIDWFFEHVDYGLIIEDDCLVSASFVEFASALLRKYEHDVRIGGITADFKFLQNELDENKYGMIKYPLIWGWATWRRAWNGYDFELKNWDGKIKDRSWLLELSPKSQKYWIANFDKIKKRKIDTWDYQFAYHILSKGLKFIHPMRNMVTNLGFGSDATHTKNIKDSTANLPKFEIEAQCYELCDEYKKYDEFLDAEYFVHKSIFQKIVSRLIKK